MTTQEFNRNITNLRPKLTLFASAFVSIGTATPEDLVQDAIIKVWAIISSGNEARNIEALLVKVLKNVCIDYSRLKKNSNNEQVQNDVLDECSPSPQKILELRDKVGMLRRTMALLPIEQQIAMRLRVVMAYDYKQISSILDTSEGNVRVLISRARLTLRDKLTELD